jgi:hypothetical protein
MAEKEVRGRGGVCFQAKEIQILGLLAHLWK